MTTLREARQFLARRLQIDEVDVSSERTLESLGIDKRARPVLLREIEDAFGLRLSGEQAHVRTVGELLVLLAWELGEHRAASDREERNS